MSAIGEGEVAASRVRRAVPWLAGVLVVLSAGSALPQGSLDAGKTPAQMFADTCSNCHRRPQELKRASAGFLRQHYTPGSQEAAAMANYLASIPAETRKERPKAPEKEKARAHVQAQERPPERSQQERPKAQLQPKAKRPEIAKSAPAEPPVETAPPSEPRTESATVVPKLEPFEE